MRDQQQAISTFLLTAGLLCLFGRGFSFLCGCHQSQQQPLDAVKPVKPVNPLASGATEAGVSCPTRRLIKLRYRQEGNCVQICLHKAAPHAAQETSAGTQWPIEQHWRRSCTNSMKPRSRSHVLCSKTVPCRNIREIEKKIMRQGLARDQRALWVPLPTSRPQRVHFRVSNAMAIWKWRMMDD